MPWPTPIRHLVDAVVHHLQTNRALFALFHSHLPTDMVIQSNIQLQKQAAEATAEHDQALRALLMTHQRHLTAEVSDAAYMIPIIGRGVVASMFIEREEDLDNGRIAATATKVMLDYLSTL